MIIVDLSAGRVDALEYSRVITELELAQLAYQVRRRLDRLAASLTILVDSPAQRGVM